MSHRLAHSLSLLSFTQCPAPPACLEPRGPGAAEGPGLWDQQVLVLDAVRLTGSAALLPVLPQDQTHE